MHHPRGVHLTGSCQSHLLPSPLVAPVGTPQSKVEYLSQRNICCLLKRLKGCFTVPFSFFSLFLSLPASRPHVCLNHQCLADQIPQRTSVTALGSTFHSTLLQLSRDRSISLSLKLHLQLPHIFGNALGS